MFKCCWEGVRCSTCMHKINAERWMSFIHSLAETAPEFQQMLKMMQSLQIVCGMFALCGVVCVAVSNTAQGSAVQFFSILRIALDVQMLGL